MRIKIVGLVFFLWGGLITYLSLTASANLPKFNIVSIDKVGHFGVYGLWFCLGLLYLYLSENLVAFKLLILAFSLIVYGALMELMQAYLPGSSRTFDYADMLANTVGVVCAFIFGRIFIKLYNKLF